MSGTTIGEVNINLRMNLANFRKDVQDGTSAAGQGARQLGESFKGGTREARESLRLLSEEIGVHIPRGLQTFIAGLPGVGTALNAAFSSVAVLAIIEIIAKVVEKITELQKKAEELKKALKESAESGVTELRKLDEETLKLQAEFDKLSGNTMKALKENIELINLEKLDKIVKQFDDLNAKAQKTLDLMKVGGFEGFLGLGNNQAVKVAQEDLQKIVDRVHELRDAGDDGSGIGEFLDKKIGELKSFKDVAFENDEHPEVRQKALNYEFQQLTQLKAEYGQVNKQADLHTKILEKTNSDSLNKESAAVLGLREKYQGLVDGFKTDALDKVFAAAAKAEAEVRKMATEDPALFKKAFPNDSVDTVIAAMQRFSKQAEDQEMLKALKEINKELADMGKTKLPDFGELKTQLPTLAKDAKTPTTGQAELEKISAATLEGQKAAAEEARKVVDSIETQSQKYKEQVAILQQLKSQGLLTEEQLKLAMEKAAADTDKANKQWSSFGEAVGKDIEQTMLFGKSWSDSIKTILTQLVALILQMTLLKQLQSSMGGGTGVGGFFSGLLGGLFGGKKASGGFVDSSHSYIVGENGPEMFTPGSSGNITPNGALMSGGGSTQVNYNIDARGADPGSEHRIKAAIKESEDRAVARAVVTSQEINKRRLS